MGAVLPGLACFVVCLAAGLGAMQGAPRDGRIVALTAAQIGAGAGLGWLIGWLLGLPAGQVAGLALIGAAPGTVAASPLVGVAGGSSTITHGVTSIGSFATVLATVAVQIAAGVGAGAAAFLILTAAFPFFLGLSLRGRVPPAILRAAPVAAGLVLFALIVGVLLRAPLGGALLPLMAASLLLALVLAIIGHRLAPDPRAGALTLPMRNVAVPIAAALAAGPLEGATVAALYGILMYLPVLALLVLMLRGNRR